MENAYKWIGITLHKTTAEEFKRFVRELIRQESLILKMEPSECYDNIHIELYTELSFEEIIDRYIEWEKKEVM